MQHYDDRHSSTLFTATTNITNGQELKALRHFLRLNQREMAEQMDTPLGTLRDWEQDRTSLPGIARAYLNRFLNQGKYMRVKIIHPSLMVRRAVVGEFVEYLDVDWTQPLEGLQLDLQIAIEYLLAAPAYRKYWEEAEILRRDDYLKLVSGGKDLEKLLSVFDHVISPEEEEEEMSKGKSGVGS